MTLPYRAYTEQLDKLEFAGYAQFFQLYYNKTVNFSEFP